LKFNEPFLFLNYKYSARPDPSGKVVLAAIDRKSRNSDSRYPWSRVKLARLVDFVAAQRPSLIVFDYYFPEKEDSASLVATAELMKSAKKAGNVVFPYIMNIKKHENVMTSKSSCIWKSSISGDKVAAFEFSGPSGYPFVVASSASEPAYMLQKVGALSGHKTMILTQDRELFYEIPLIQYDTCFFPSLALISAMQYRDVLPSELRVSPREKISFDYLSANREKTSEIPLNAKGLRMVNFLGPAGTFPAYSAVNFLEGITDKSLLRDKIVIIGPTFSGDDWMFETPIGALSSSEIQANMIENILTGNYIIENSGIGWINMILAISVALLLSWIIRRTRGSGFYYICFAGAVVSVLISYFLFLFFNYWFGPGFMLAACLFVLAAGIYYDTRIKPYKKAGSGRESSESEVRDSEGNLKKAGKYQITELIGSGAMGSVYKALDPAIGRTVALKTVRSDLLIAGEDIKKRFLQEARAAGNLNHPNIVTIFDFGECRDFAYIAMEFIEGKPLSELIGEDGIGNLSLIYNIMSQITAALDYAHSKGVIHRDIKPANIIYSRSSETVKLLDFGTAKLVDTALTQTGNTLGTPNYMSPEQINGDIVDYRTDIFSAGAVLYEMLTGKRPFKGENIASLSTSILTTSPPAPSMHKEDLPAGFDLIINKALARERDERYSKASGISEDVRKVLY
ncbi:MAG: protein kinase domain-containing protein, partial [Fibrobacterota bacterium]